MHLCDVVGHICACVYAHVSMGVYACSLKYPFEDQFWIHYRIAASNILSVVVIYCVFKHAGVCMFVFKRVCVCVCVCVRVCVRVRACVLLTRTPSP